MWHGVSAEIDVGCSILYYSFDSKGRGRVGDIAVKGIAIENEISSNS